MKDKEKQVVYGMVTVVSIMAFLGLLALFTGKGLLSKNAYNAYALQADSWRQGRLDLGQDYPWMELAIYNGKYYCSFPPFPSYVLFPLTFIWGSNTYDYVILWACNIIAVIFLYKIALELKNSPESAMIQVFFVTIASNMVFIMIDASIWFLAQTMCFTLSTVSIYFALKGKGAVALFCWAASVGCRPMQFLYFPIVLILLYRHVRREKPYGTWYQMMYKNWYWSVPSGFLAVSYMALNYFRFNNILEFGHNYLPEFVRAEYGQFNICYIKENLKTLFRLPEFAEDGKMKINNMGNLNLFIVSPIIMFAVLLLAYIIWKRVYNLMGIYILNLLLSVAYLFIVVMHKSMGAWHFGNRYANDILPWIFLGVCMVMPRFRNLIKYEIPLCVAGACLNAVGTVVVYNGLGT